MKKGGTYLYGGGQSVGPAARAIAHPAQLGTSRGVGSQSAAARGFAPPCASRFTWAARTQEETWD